MKHLFIINPAAGKYDKTGEFTQLIRAAFSKRGIAFEILVSRAPGDCAAIAQAAAATGDPVRIYACGGDGTLNEVANGVAGYANAAVTHFPGGSGNDFIRIFSDPTAFKSLDRLLDCEVATFDMIRRNQSHYAVNVCSMGFDARIGTSIGKYKRLPLVSGSGAYALSTGVNLIKGIHRHYVVTIDGETFDGRQSMICIANGRWYGSGFYPLPCSEPDDGLLDVVIVENIPRKRLIARRMGLMRGKILDFPETCYRRVRALSFSAPGMRVNVDGEIIPEARAEIRLLPEALWICR